MAERSPRSPSGAAVMRGEITAALTRALFAEWSRVGYAALSLEAVAARAGVGKAALYRRWPSKPAMALDRLTALGLAATRWPDTGSLAGDVDALLRDFRRLLGRPLVRRILADLHAEIGRSHELAAGIEPLQTGRRRAAAEILRRAVLRGELRAGVDLEIGADLVAAPLYWRTVVVRLPSDEVYLDRLGAATLAALRAL